MREVGERTVRAADGLPLHVIDWGGTEGPPLLFVHGSFGHARLWDFAVAALPRERRAIALDLPGHGESAHAAREERYAFDRLVDDLRGAVELLNEPPVMAGHSIGSALTMHYAAAHAATLSGAVLMDIDPHPPEQQARHLNEVGRQAPKAYPTLDGAVAREARMAPGASPAAHLHMARHGYRPGVDGLEQKFDQGFLRSVRTWDARPLLARITVPALVVRGSESTVMSPEGYRDLLVGLPNARGELVAGATHQLHLERPAVVATLIERFVAGLG